MNSAKFSVSGTTTSDTYFRGGVFAPDRTDLNLDKLPENKGIVGVWRFGLFTSTALSEAKTFGSVDLDLRYDHVKLPDGRHYRLYLWNGSAGCALRNASSTTRFRGLSAEGWSVASSSPSCSTLQPAHSRKAW